MSHDIITRDANSVSWAKIWEFSKSQRDIIDAVTISKIIVFEIIWYVAYHSAAKFTFPIEQPSNMAAKCGIGRSWKLKLKPNLGCCCNYFATSKLRPFWKFWNIEQSFNFTSDMKRSKLCQENQFSIFRDRRSKVNVTGLLGHRPWHLNGLNSVNIGVIKMK